MQVAAANPSYVGRNDVPAPVIEREKTIYREQAKASGKPDKILDKIADGKAGEVFRRFLPRRADVHQGPGPEGLAAPRGRGGRPPAPRIAVCAFARFQVGEGMEKRSDDLAAEVAKQLGQG